MLTILKTVILAFVWLVLPILTGCLFGLFPQREYRKRRSAYLIGSLTIWALFYGLARIALDGKWTLTKLTKVFCVLLAVLTILSTGVIIYRWHMRELIRIKSRTKLAFHSSCSSAYPCGRGRICGEPDGRAYGGAGHDHVHDGFAV